MSELKPLTHLIVRMLDYVMDGKPYQMTEKDYEYMEKVMVAQKTLWKSVPTVADMCLLLPTWTREEVAVMSEKFTHIDVKMSSFKQFMREVYR